MASATPTSSVRGQSTLVPEEREMRGQRHAEGPHVADMVIEAPFRAVQHTASSTWKGDNRYEVGATEHCSLGGGWDSVVGPRRTGSCPGSGLVRTGERRHWRYYNPGHRHRHRGPGRCCGLRAERRPCGRAGPAGGPHQQPCDSLHDQPR